MRVQGGQHAARLFLGDDVVLVALSASESTGIAVSRINNYIHGEYGTIRPDHLSFPLKATGRTASERAELHKAYVVDLLPEARALAHSHVQTTARYLQTTDGELDQVVLGFDPLAPAKPATAGTGTDT